MLPQALFRALSTLGAPGEALFEWISTTYPTWARQNAQDAETLKNWCATHSGKLAQ